MATQAYYTWVAAGRPYRLATPIQQLKNYAHAHGWAFLGDIGDDVTHLQADLPEDHCPFSFTAWPVPLPGYVVTAIDLRPPADVPLRVLADAKSGKAPWLKYMNWANVHYDIAEGWKPRYSGDEHWHISIRSDWCDRSIATYLEGLDMPSVEEIAAGLAESKPFLLAVAKAVMVFDSPNDGKDYGAVANVPWAADAKSNLFVQTRNAIRQGWIEAHGANAGTAAALTKLDALAAAVAKLSGDPVDEAAIVAGVLAGLTPQAIAAAIPPELAHDVALELAAIVTRGAAA